MDAAMKRAEALGRSGASYSNVWKVQYGDITAVAVYIQRLRKKIEKNPNECEYIKTDFGKGYIFCI